MALNAALIERLDIDMFRGTLPNVDSELQRRLTILLEQLREIITELAGSQLVNQNITYYAEATPADPNISEEAVEEGRTITVNGLDDNGLAVSLKFITGRLQI